MRLFDDPISFEWDRGNTGKNLRKHHLVDQEAEEAFFDELAIVVKNETHSQAEARYLLYGTAGSGKKLAIVFTIRKEKVRIISARPMNRKERSVYEEKTKNHPEIQE